MEIEYVQEYIVREGFDCHALKSNEACAIQVSDRSMLCA